MYVETCLTFHKNPPKSDTLNFSPNMVMDFLYIGAFCKNN